MTAKKILSDAAKFAGLSARTKSLWLMHPILETMCLKLAGFITMHAVDEIGKPLLSTALLDAIKAYDETIDNGGDEDRAMPPFIRSLLNSGTEVFNQDVSVETPSGSVMWQPFASGLTEFLNEYPDCSVTVKRKASFIKKTVATAFVSTWLAPRELLNTELWAEILNELED